MYISIALGAWMIPTIITVCSIVYALYMYDDGSSEMFSGLGNIFMLIPAMFISMVSWIVYAVFK